VLAWGSGWLGVPAFAAARRPIRVGLLHSLTGPMAISEKSMVDAETLALEEIRQQGGLLGRPVEWVLADGKSDGPTFARKAEELIRDEKVSAIFGCWTSACRKSVKPVVERLDHLLFYPVAYEGLEESPNIIYTGAAPNQQTIPTVNWCHEVLEARRFYLVGTDSVWPHSANTIIKDQLKALGATLAGESYIRDGRADVDEFVRRLTEAKPDIVLSTMEGDLNLPFYQRLRAAGVVPSKTPVLTYSLTEDEFRSFPPGMLSGDYAVCNYFQAVRRPENEEFVRRFKARFGPDRVTCDAIATAYNSVRLWAQAVTEAESADTRDVQAAILRQSLDAPEGVISVDRESRHTWRPFFVGRIRNDGQVDIVWNALKPIRPVPFPFSRSRKEWQSFLDALSAGWGGGWEAPPSAPPRRSSAEIPAGPGRAG
jgi:urea transport system substrate-binding protein